MTRTPSPLHFFRDLTAISGSLLHRLAAADARRIPTWRHSGPVRSLPSDGVRPETLPVPNDGVRRGDRAAYLSPAATSIPARAAADGARAGVIIAVGVATWIGVRAAFGDPGHPDVAPLSEALRWSGERLKPVRSGAQWTETAAALATIVASLVAATALVGGLCGAALTSTTVHARVAVLLSILAGECTLWQLAGGHTGPWLRATIWYHLATAVLTLVVVLERTAVALPQHGDARAGPSAERGHA